MAKTYRLGLTRRFGNAMVKALLRTPLVPPHYVLLTVVGRVSGRRYSTPVRPIEHDGQRFLVAPYGAVAWVRNARAAGQVTLSRGRRRETVAVVECSPRQSAVVLRRYVRAVPVTRPYFDAGPDDPVDRFASEASRHPVLRIVDVDHGAARVDMPATRCTGADERVGTPVPGAATATSGCAGCAVPGSSPESAPGMVRPPHTGVLVG